MCPACDIALPLHHDAGPGAAAAQARQGGTRRRLRSRWRRSLGVRSAGAGRRSAALRQRAARSIRSACQRHLPHDQMDRAVRHAGHLLSACRSCAGTAGRTRPSQAVLVDFPNRRFYFFFIEIWPQEVYYLTGLLILAAMTLFLMNAVAGRVWCGYLCPQTVWTDLFQAIERWVEGDRREHMLRDQQPWTAERVARARAQALPVADGRLVDRRRLGALFRRRADAGEGASDLPGAVRRLCLDRHPHLHDLRARRPHARAGLPLHVPVAAHPGGADRRARAQRHLSLRSRRAARLGQEERGAAREGHAGRRLHRLPCNACYVCPTGVDIRNGPNLGCIQCGLCIDACDAVMAKIGRPARLIAYDTDLNIKRRQEGEPAVYRIVRLRTVLYAAVIAVVGAVMLYALATRGERGDQRHPRPQPDLRAARRRRDAQCASRCASSTRRWRRANFVLTVDGLPMSISRSSATGDDRTQRR